VNEAINQAYQSKNYTGMQNRWIGETDSGMEIMFYLDKEDKVISAFPVI
ncbi:EndoU domain-containing protein, partial [Listeria welshimeri]|nr:EndoU domain-containing protein [Listeria welshimeri]